MTPPQSRAISAFHRHLCDPRHFGRVAALLALFAAVFHVLTLEPRGVWYGDSYQLLLHAENLLEGRPYADTGYIQNPARYLAPVAYPPGYPALLVPVLVLFGADPVAIAVLNALLIAGAVWGVVHLARLALAPPYAYALGLVVGLHPYLWEFKYDPLSDLPFLCLVVLCLLAYDRAVNAAESRRKVALAALAGGLLWAASLTRPLGIVVLMSFVAHDLVRFRCLGRPLLVVIGVGGALFGAYVLLFDPSEGARVANLGAGGGAGGYGTLVARDLGHAFGNLPKRVIGRLVDYARASYLFWLVPGPGGGVAKNVLMGLSLVPVGVGVWRRARRSFSVVETFSLLYLLSLLPWTFAGTRYLIPLVPFYYLYLFAGLDRLSEVTRRVGRYATVATAVVISAIFVARYVAILYSEPVANTLPDNSALAFLREETPPETVVATTDDPRASLFYTRRASSIVPRDPGQWVPYAEAIGADYLLVTELPAGVQRVADISERFRFRRSDGGVSLYEMLPASSSGLP